MYVYKTEPYKHQKEIFENSWKARQYALFLEMGTGKTKIAIDSLAALYEAKSINTVLVVAPKGVYANWVDKEIPQHLPDRINYKIVQWQPNITKKFREALTELADPKHTDLHILAMNVEALSTIKGASSAFKFLKMNPNNLFIMDESTAIKNRKALRTKNALKAAGLAKYKRILTGSPITKNPMDLFSQCNFLSVKLLNFKSFFAYQARYAVVRRRMMGARSFQEITGYQRLDELHDKLGKFSARVLKEDCLDLPDKIYTSRRVPLTKEQLTAYVQMKKLALARLEKGELSTTASVLTQIMRLQEICCGHLKMDDGTIQEIPNKRLDELFNTIDEMSGKVIIWATWVYDLARIVEKLQERYGRDSAEAFYGATPQDKRQEIVKNFQKKEHPLRFFVGNPKTGGYGLTLTAATNVIYWNNSYDLETRIQSEDRAHRIGQDNHVLYVDLISPNTVDEKILKALKSKISIAQEVLGEEGRDWLI
jgi:SNF2 family DNA or RNA helicase|tara:strand:+ start:7343 stop:8785 length:1443 start_codon:yes stop_codon:yes gene_type:complete